MRVLAIISLAVAAGAVPQPCDAGDNYCGWFLANTLGWQNIPDTTGLWRCTENGAAAAYVEHCALNCTGGLAACPPLPGTGTTTTSATTTTSSTKTSHTHTPWPTWGPQ
ncbi:uncharacterized protein CDV56_106999 [Aspergillus thermomutatus]|uniref:Uncharacterized protein n=1 Tax=Aspergillus thermomutatus TaxID=41047 RepID=A0A397GRP3_ASPTH|nr:uncharacterized protein CDV56_106999 [Aspergillus thermomutatus]RHZ53267.1 hypothetical protein CDV56_106999 [Aspergillus thermomutatus]